MLYERALVCSNLTTVEEFHFDPTGVVAGVVAGGVPCWKRMRYRGRSPVTNTQDTFVAHDSVVVESCDECFGVCSLG